jgi:putative aminopeptidase FrvX
MAKGERVPIVAALALLLAAAAGRAAAQTADPALSDLAVRLAAMTAVTGYEQWMIDSLIALVPGAERDRAGNAVVVLGAGSRRRLVACPVSEPGFIVGGVRPDGWMTLRRAPGRVSPLVEQQIEGQRVTVFGRRGAVPGVIGVRSIHLTRGRGTAGQGAFTLDSAYLDIGAGSRAGVAGAGVGVLSPLALARDPHRYGTDLLAAPLAARRTACAALVLAARRAVAERGMVPRGERVVVAFVVEQELGGRGLGTLANAGGPFEETVVVDGAPGAPGALVRGPDSLTARWPGLGRVTRWSLGARYAGTPVETTSIGGADSLRGALTAWIGGAR